MFARLSGNVQATVFARVQLLSQPWIHNLRGLGANLANTRTFHLHIYVMVVRGRCRSVEICGAAAYLLRAVGRRESGIFPLHTPGYDTQQPGSLCCLFAATLRPLCCHFSCLLSVSDLRFGFGQRQIRKSKGNLAALEENTELVEA